jgi:tetratricopeptide (TPR) repeat protein
LALVLMIILNSGSLFAQEDEYGVGIDGTVFQGREKLSGVKVTIKTNGKLFSESTTDGNGSFEHKLNFDRIYRVYFSKDGFAEKYVEVDTRNVPQDQRKLNYAYRRWKVDLFRDDLDVNYGVLNRPLARVVYIPGIAGFDLDKKYEKTIRPAYEKLYTDVQNALDREEQLKEQLYKDYLIAIEDGDNYLKEGYYEDALVQYEAANEMRPEEPYPIRQLKKVNQLIAESQGVEERYAELLNQGDIAFDANKWEESKGYYLQATELKKKEQYPKDQLAAIDKAIAAELAAAESAEQARIRKEYDALIMQADAKFTAAAYSEAKPLYQKAQTKLPSEPYPKQKIDEIENILRSQAEADKEYQRIKAKADKAFMDKDYSNAVTQYQNALQVKPNDGHSTARISEIEALLAGIAALQAENERLARAAQEQKEKNYKDFIEKGDIAFKARNYPDAITRYESALEIFSDRTYPKDQIKLANNELAKLEGLDKQYQRVMAAGDQNMVSKEYEKAVSNYEQALTFKPGDERATAQLAEARNKLASIAAALAAEGKALNDQYDAAVKAGDDAFAAANYTQAILSYERASDIKSNEPYPREQIKKANAELAKLEGIEKQYERVMRSGDQNLASKDYEKAVEYYDQALNLKPNDTRAAEQRNKAKAELAAIAAGLAAQQKALNDKYDAEIRSGDASFSSKKYAKAIQHYETALELKPNEVYPREQLKLANSQLARLEGVEKQYERVMKSGDQKLASGDFEQAKGFYEQALDLKPNDERAVAQLNKAKAELAAIAAALVAEQKALNDRYNAAINSGDASFNAQNYEQAKSSYQQAVALKPSEAYPKNQILLIEDKLNELAQQARMEEMAAAALARKQEQYDQAIGKADKLLASKDYVSAKSVYAEAQGIFPEKTYPAQKIQEIDGILAGLAAADAERKAAETEAQKKEDQYKEMISQGDAAMAQKNWDSAELAYKGAMALFPSRTYAGSQLKKIEGFRAEEARLAELEKQREEDRIKIAAAVRKLIDQGDQLMKKESFESAKYKYEAALKQDPGNEEASTKMMEAERRYTEQQELLKYYAENDTEFNKELAKKYPQGKSEKTFKEGNKTVTQTVIVKGDRGDEYRKEVYSWGQVFYLKNGKKINESVYKKEVR